MLKKLFNHNIGGDVRCVMVLSRFFFQSHLCVSLKTTVRHRYCCSTVGATTVGSFRLEYKFGIEYFPNPE